MSHTDKCIDLLSGRKNDGKPLAQFAEMESAEKPMTWNERINQMTVEEKAHFSLNKGKRMHNEASNYAYDCLFSCVIGSFEDHYVERMTELLNSPYTE